MNEYLEVAEGIFNAWLDNEASYSDLVEAFEAGYNGEKCRKQLPDESYNHEYEYIESAFGLGKMAKRLGSVEAFKAEIN